MKFKGHTTIELRDVVTGEVKKYEDDNMMTNALSKMLNFAVTHALGDSPLDIYTSHWYNLLGGLVLFDDTLTEDADNIYPPASAKPMGYGMVGDTNSYTGVVEWGIYNTQESDTSATDTKIMVWDFATSHANGTIASVALTHRNAGLFGFGITTNQNTSRQCLGRIALGTTITQSSKGKQGRNQSCYGVVGSNLSLNDGSYVDFCIDSDNDVKYMFKVCADGISVISHKMYPEQIDVYKGAENFQSYEEDTYAETFGGSYFYHFYNPDDKALYFWTLDSDVTYWSPISASIPIHKFDMTTGTLTKAWKTFSVSSNGTTFNSFVVTSAGMYVVRYNDNAWRITKYDSTSGTATDVWTHSGGLDNTGFIGRRSWIRNGLIFFPHVWTFAQNAAYTMIVDTDTDTVRYTNTYCVEYNYSDPSRVGFVVPSIDNTQLACGTMLNANESQQGAMTLQQYEGSASQVGNIFAPIQYLGTINNLSEAIVKTAQQTMKVTYTITVEEE